MRKSELKPLVGRLVRFRSNRTMNSLDDIQVGRVGEIAGREVCIRGDWHDIRSLEVLGIIEEHPE